VGDLAGLGSGVGGATQHAGVLVAALPGVVPLPPAPVFAQSQDGKLPLIRFWALASHNGPGYVLPRLLGSRVGENDSVSGPTGENWRR
jgi:hypothetical protein